MGAYIRKFFFIILILAWFPTSALAEEWQDIRPAVATRSDIIRLFQKCQDRTTECEFHLDRARIRVVFSGMVQDYFYECSKQLPTDTVLLVEVTPEVPIPLRNYERRYRLKRLGKTSEFSGYFDERAGLVLKTKSNKIIQLNYVANSSDRLRCKGYYNDPVKFVAVVSHCPPVSLEGPSEAVTAGEIVNFNASVQPDPKMTLTWTVSGGTIVTLSGRQMSLDTSGLDGQTLKVTIQARGSCSVENSMTLPVRPHARTADPIRVLFSGLQVGVGQEWRGIKPLRSTCEDVKRAFGVNKCEYPRSTYRLENEIVEVTFVTCPCASVCYDEKRGWNLPPDTVTSIRRELRNGQPIAEFDVDSGKWTKTYTDFAGQVIHGNEELGLTLSEVDGVVLSITYYPPLAKNRQFLCPKCSQTLNKNKELSRSSWFRAYGDINFDNEKSRLDAFAMKLKEQAPNSQGFIVVYAGCRPQKGDAQARAERAKEYIIRAHSIDSDQIKTIDGGQREEMLIELHIRARGLPAPSTSSSTYPPLQSRQH